MRIQRTSIFVDDQRLAIAFYTDVLGFTKHHDIPPSSRSTANRWRRLPTVVQFIPSRSAISTFVPPSATASTIRHGSANACEDE